MRGKRSRLDKKVVYNNSRREFTQKEIQLLELGVYSKGGKYLFSEQGS